MANQAKCYDLIKEIPCGDNEFPRQAGDYAQLGQADHYKFVSTDIVFDKSTKLFWLKCTLGKSHNVCDEPSAMTWSEAKQACAKLDLLQYVWRLPTVMELNSLIELENKTVKISTDYFPDTEKAAYWTREVSLTYKTQGNRAWFVDFSRASIFDASVDSKHFVRCVSTGK